MEKKVCFKHSPYEGYSLKTIKKHGRIEKKKRLKHVLYTTMHAIPEIGVKEFRLGTIYLLKSAIKSTE